MKTHLHLERNRVGAFVRFGLWTFLAAVVIAGCARSGDQERIVIRGSNTIGEELAGRLITAFRTQGKDVAFDTEFKGTSYGIGALMVGSADLAAASREITTNERALTPNLNLADYVFASYSVVVIANTNNPINKLEQAQVRDIFTGKIQNWKEVGGADAPIHLYIRNPASGTYLGFQELAMEKQPYGLHLKSFTNYAGIIDAVMQDTNGIGYSSMRELTNPQVTPIYIDGVAPTPFAVNQGRYPYSRTLRFYTNKDKETTAVSDFIKFVLGPQGQKIVTEFGYVPKQ